MARMYPKKLGYILGYLDYSKLTIILNMSVLVFVRFWTFSQISFLAEASHLVKFTVRFESHIVIGAHLKKEASDWFVQI